MKGMELPISTVVILAVAVLVLIVVTAFFLSQSGSQFRTIDAQNKFNRLCGTIKCNSQQLSAINKGSEFYKACQELYGSDISPARCLLACGCGAELLTEGATAESVDGDIKGLSEDPFLTQPIA